MNSTVTTLYGIRHHGPGSARSVRAALAEQGPDVVLIEGPPEADGLVALAADEQMRPPVALLGYVPGQAQQAAFWPFAVFSPEWQAIRYALDAGVPVRFCDLPAAHQLAMAMKEAGEVGGEAPPRRRTDPVSELAAAAGLRGPGALVGGRGRARPGARGLRRPGRGHRRSCAAMLEVTDPRDAHPRGAHAESAAPDRQGRVRAGSRWSAVPGTCRPCGTCRPRPRTTGCCAACRR